MTDIRKPTFDAFIAAARASGVDNPFNDEGNIYLIHNLMDGWGIKREKVPPKHEMKDPAEFFKAVRRHTGGLDQVQVDTLNGLLAAASHWSIGWLAYGLATAWHECRFRPIDEIGKGRGRAYGKPGARMKAVDVTPLYGGQIPYGRGLVQLTWCDNYEWADAEAAKAGLIKKGDILANFDLVKRPDIAAFILVRGMETGAFTGKKLANYINERGTLQQFTLSRKIINGTDKDDEIAGHAMFFQGAADAGKWA